MDTQKRTLRVGKVARKCDFGTSTVWRLVHSDPDFPQPIKLSPGCTVWYEHEIDQWIDNRARKQRAASTKATEPIFATKEPGLHRRTPDAGA